MPEALTKHRDYDDIPGTFVFDGRLAQVGYPLNALCMSLNNATNRQDFALAADEYMSRYGLSDAQRAAVKDRDWLKLLELGGNIYFLLKIAICDGTSIQDVAAAMSGVTKDDFVQMMRDGGRSPQWPS